MDFATQIKSLREAKSLTQGAAAEAMGVSKSILEKWERGDRTPLQITQEGAVARLSRLKPKTARLRLASRR
jgi:transcriptional regulator with XRE-family HTH domain